VWLQRRPNRYGGTLSPVTVNTIVRSVRTFCNWMREEGYVTEDYFRRRNSVPKVPEVRKAALSDTEFERLLETVRRSTRYRLRNEAILLFMVDTGVRAREVCGMRFADVDLKARTAKVFGKGSKERVVVYSATTASAMLRYVNSERFLGETFFTSEKFDGQLSYNGLAQVFQRLSRESGIYVHAHKLRHTSATWLAGSGANAFEIQKQLGHATLDISLRYVHLNEANLRETIERHSPVEGMTRRSRQQGR
jgi:site-specific recombinase XerD